VKYQNINLKGVERTGFAVCTSLSCTFRWTVFQMPIITNASKNTVSSLSETGFNFYKSLLHHGMGISVFILIDLVKL